MVEIVSTDSSRKFEIREFEFKLPIDVKAEAITN